MRRKLQASLYLRDVLWQASGNSAAQILGIAAMPLLTRLYAPSDFAALTLFSQVVAGLTILMTLRYEYLVMLPVNQQESERVLSVAIRLGAVHIIWLTPLLTILPSYWPWLQSQRQISDWLWLAPISAFAVSLAIGLQQMVQRRGDFRASATSELVGRCAYIFSALAGALVLPNVVGLMTSTLANAFGKFSYLLRAANNLALSSLLTNTNSISKSTHKLAWSTSTSNLVALVSGLAPMVFIADNYGANALGQYGLVVATLYLPTTLLGQAIGQVYYQRACSLHSEGMSLSHLLVETSHNLIRVGIPLYAVIALFSPLAYPIVFGAQWESAGEMAQWLSIAAAAGFISTPLDRTSIVVNAWWYLMTWHSLRATTTCATLLLVAHQNMDIQACVASLSIQMATLYICDLLASHWFTKRSSATRLNQC